MKLSQQQQQLLADGFALSPREREIVTLLFDGVGSNSDLAQALGVTPATAKIMLHNVYVKTGRSTKHELIVHCLDMLATVDRHGAR
jgi:DNA-binding CsgD family transcriptional regulator